MLINTSFENIHAPSEYSYNTPFIKISKTISVLKNVTFSNILISN